MDKKKGSTTYANMARAAIPKSFWALSKPEFDEHASNNDSSLKQRMKK